MTSEKLTLKQEKFCQKYFENGGNATQAYREVYNCEKMRETTITNNAYKLLKNNDVTTMLNELKEQLQKKFEYTAEMSFRKLIKIQELVLTEEYKNPNAWLKAEDLIQKITGLQKQVLMGDKDNPISISSQIIHNFVKADDVKKDEEK